MSKFYYCSSEDELRWQCDHHGLIYRRLSRDALNDIGRNNLRQWIEDYCQDNVYAWNETETPFKGSSTWQQQITPSGNVTLYFVNEKDAALFSLKWSCKPIQLC